LLLQEAPKLVKEEELVIRFYCQQIFLLFGLVEETKPLIRRSLRAAVRKIIISNLCNNVVYHFALL